MKTKYEHIYFERMWSDPDIWKCFNFEDGKTLGTLKYDYSKKGFIFSANDDVIFLFSDLDDISHFLKQLNAERSGNEA